MRRIVLHIGGSFSLLSDKKEFRHLETLKDQGYDYEGKMKSHSYRCKKKSSKGTYLFGDEYLMCFEHGVYDEFFGYVGRIIKIEGGFASKFLYENYTVGFHETREEASAYLLEKGYSRIKEASFGFLARKEFGYTPNYLQNELGKIDEEYIADILIKDGYGSYFKHNKGVALKIIREYFEAKIINCFDQGGYITADGYGHYSGFTRKVL